MKIIITLYTPFWKKNYLFLCVKNHRIWGPEKTTQFILLNWVLHIRVSTNIKLGGQGPISPLSPELILSALNKAFYIGFWGEVKSYVLIQSHLSSCPWILRMLPSWRQDWDSWFLTYSFSHFIDSHELLKVGWVCSLFFVLFFQVTSFWQSEIIFIELRVTVIKINSLDQHCPVKFSVKMEVFWSCTSQHGSHQSM